MTNKRILKKDFQIKKVRKVLKTEFGNMGTYTAYKVTGPNRTKKYFITREHAVNFINKVTDRTFSK